MQQNVFIHFHFFSFIFCVDIEYSIDRCNPAIRSGCGAAFTLTDSNGEEKLALLYEVRPGKIPDNLIDNMSNFY